MTDGQWNKIKHFKKEEKWGEPEMMDFRLIWMLDKVRKELNRPIIIHCGYETSGHSPNSLHYRGKAVDFHIPHNNEREYKDLCVYINELWWFGGMGTYQHWNNPGFHLDIGNYRRWNSHKGKLQRVK